MYWRMQLHPSDSDYSVSHAVDCLGHGYIGLDFKYDVGDLKLIKNRHDLPDGQHSYWEFAHSMKCGERVLIIAHHYPFALATIDSQYNYIRHPDPYIGWFRHFRCVKDILYYGDFQKNPQNWEKIIMTETFAPLVEDDTKSYRLIEEWIAF